MSTENLEKQRELYGDSLAAISGRITGALGLTQARLADVLGISAPMLSQLLSARRVKVGNPLALERLRELARLAEEAPRLRADEREARLTAIRESTGTLTDARARGHADADGRGAAVLALRALADREELERLAAETAAPRLAELLREAANG